MGEIQMNPELIQKEINEIKKNNIFISSKELAYQVIMNLIIQRSLQSGERIVQDTLADSMGISRSPIREALMKLTEEGFLEKNDKNSYIVAGIRLKDYVDYCEMRLRMESYAAALAVRNMTDDVLGKLEENVSQYRKTTDIAQARKLDEAFHHIIIQTSKNPYIIDFSQKTLKRKAYYSRYLVHAENMSAAEVEHQKIYEAICNYDEKQAEEMMKLHLKNYLDKLYDII